MNIATENRIVWLARIYLILVVVDFVLAVKSGDYFRALIWACAACWAIPPALRFSPYG